MKKNHDLSEFKEITDFLRSQRLSVKPNPENLRQALLQASLLQDEKADWSGLMRFWKPFMGVTMGAFGVGILLWSPGITNEENQIARDWESEFMAEVEDFYKTKAELEPLYAEPLFSASTNNYQS